MAGPVIHFLFVSLLMIFYRYRILMSITGRENSDTRQRGRGEQTISAQAFRARLLKSAYGFSSERGEENKQTANKLDSGSCASASDGGALCLHLLIGPLHVAAEAFAAATGAAA